jgi:mannose-6-phosphate isomerase-like protein (cupin superfamily)
MGLQNLLFKLLHTLPLRKPHKPTTEPIVLAKDHITQMPAETFAETDRGIVTWKTLFSAPNTPSNSLTAGVAICPPKNGHLCIHQHLQPEIYHVISGTGIVEIDGVEYEVEGGSVVYIPGDARHGIRNTSEDDELRWFYVFPVDGFGEIQYRF